MQFIPLGDSALLINSRQEIDPEVNDSIHQLSEMIKRDPPEGFQACIPAYCSLTVVFDPLVTDHQKIEHLLQKHISEQEFVKPKKVGSIHQIPVCYEQIMGLDLGELSTNLQMNKEAIIRLHCSHAYRVYMMGFLPGFAYLGKLPEKLFSKRKLKPRLKVPARSVAIAGFQTAVYPTTSPGGWNIVGRSPANLLSLEKENPFLLHPGDMVRFYRISLDSYYRLEEQFSKEKFDSSIVYD